MCGGNFPSSRLGKIGRDRRFSSFDVSDCFMVPSSFSANICLDSGVTTNTLLNHSSAAFNHDSHLLNYDTLNVNET